MSCRRPRRNRVAKGAAIRRPPPIEIRGSAGDNVMHQMRAALLRSAPKWRAGDARAFVVAMIAIERAALRWPPINEICRCGTLPNLAR